MYINNNFINISYNIKFLITNIGFDILFLKKTHFLIEIKIVYYNILFYIN